MNVPFFRVLFCCGLFVLGIAFSVNADEVISAKSTGLVDGEFIVKREDIPEVDLVVLHLKNGMKVCLKRTESDDEMVVRLTAAGGYTSLPDSQRASAQYASQIAIHSGVGNYHFDQLYALLYDHSIEFNSEVQAFSRYVEGTAFMGEVDILMNLINLFFTQHHFTEHSFRKVMEKSKEKISHRNKRLHRNFEDTYMDFNTPNNSAFRVVTEKDIKQADYRVSKDFFDNGFSDPSEFACVIAGSFDMEKMVALVKKYLATIPVVEDHKTVCKIPDFPEPAKGIKTKIVQNHYASTDSITVLTFPVGVDITDENFISVENIAGLLYIRLKKVLRERYGMDCVAINVSTEYPLYPCLTSPWIKIQYITDQKFVSPMGQTILSELKKMKSDFVTKEEIAIMNRKYRKAQRLHEKDNYYWLMVLSNYVMWKWDPTDLPSDLKPLAEDDKIKKGLQTYFSLDNFTIISSQP